MTFFVSQGEFITLAKMLGAKTQYVNHHTIIIPLGELRDRRNSILFTVDLALIDAE